MGVSNAVANIRRPLGPYENLRDLSFEYLPHYPTNDLANHLVYGCITFTSWVLLLHPRRRHLTRRLLSMWSIVYAMRATTISVTSLPDPNDMCRNGTIENGIGTFFSGLSCGDMIFSGHTVALILGPLMMHQAFPRMPRWAAWCLWGYCIFGMWALLACHMHYLVDILVAVYISFLVYLAYHATVTNDRWLQRYEWLAWWEHDRYYSCTWSQYWDWIKYKFSRDPNAIDPRYGQDPSFDHLLPEKYRSIGTPLSPLSHASAPTNGESKSPSSMMNGDSSSHSLTPSVIGQRKQ